MFLSVLPLLVGCAIAQVIPSKSRTNDGEYNVVNTDGSFDFGYANPDAGSSYHVAHGDSAKTVAGRFGAREPGTGKLKETLYTAGARGYRAQGPDIHRIMDLDQRPRAGPIGNKDDPYFDPNEDPSYAFKFNSNTYSKDESANSLGDVTGQYTFVDDVGERHTVTYVAGQQTGFHVKSPLPDSGALTSDAASRPLRLGGPLVRGEAKPRGKTSIQRGLDGSYKFIASGPDQRRAESSDSNGNVRGSYAYLDDKGVQRTVHYIAGPGIGYRIVKNSKDPYIPSYFPSIPDGPDFSVAPDNIPTNVATSSSENNAVGNDDVFGGPDGAAASGHVKPHKQNAGSKYDKGYVNDKRNDDDGKYYNKDGGKYYNSGSKYDDEFSKGGGRPFADDESRFFEGNVYDGSNERRGYDAPRRYNSVLNTQSKTKSSYVPLGPVRPQGGVQNRDFDSKETKTKNSNRDSYNTDSGAKAFKKPESDGGTILRNVGDDYIGVAPGVAVRAHVQSIDLYPFGSKVLSPSETMEKEANILS